MATHSSALAWKIPWIEEPGRLQAMGSLSWTLLSNFTFTFPFHALKKEMATHSSVFAWRIPGTGSLVGCRLWGHAESDATEATEQQQQQLLFGINKPPQCLVFGSNLVRILQDLIFYVSYLLLSKVSLPQA